MSDHLVRRAGVCRHLRGVLSPNSPIALAKSVGISATREWHNVVMLTYSQTSGEFRATTGELLGIGYAGRGACVNNSALQSACDRSLLPRGIYTVNPSGNTARRSPYVMRLTPDPSNQTFSRSGFGICAGEIADLDKRLTSRGYMVVSSEALVAIWAAALADDRKLRVVGTILYIHKRVQFETRPKELQEGGWKANFDLVEDSGSQMVVTNYEGALAFPTREVAVVAAICSARREIDRRF